MNPTAIIIRPALPSDRHAVLALMDDATLWLHSIGFGRQWPAAFSGVPFWVDAFGEWIGSGKVYVAEGVDGSDGIDGAFRLEESGSRNFLLWPEDDLPALYLFSLAVRRRAAGRGLGLVMLDWAAATAKAQGKVLRLDCWAANGRLKRYYLDAGFAAMGEVPFNDRPNDGPYALARFQRAG